MTTTYMAIRKNLMASPKTWLVTGVAGFIGSNLLEALLQLNQRVVGLDNFSTGYQHNLDEVRANVSPDQWSNFKFIEGDIRILNDCKSAVKETNYVLHHAALGSVSRSIEDPINVNANNIDGFLNMLVAARDAKVDRFVYAASSSTYGDHPGLPKTEEEIGQPLSPYAVTKLVNEIYADVFARIYEFGSIGLRYFNIFGRRQDPEGSYAAVIPKWVSAMVRAEDIYINGDGETSRDFCYIDNVVQANLLSAVSTSKNAVNQIYNVGLGTQCDLNELYSLIKNCLLPELSYLRNARPTHREFVVGEVRHSVADTTKITKALGYCPTHNVEKGLIETVKWVMAKNAQHNLT